MIVILSIKDFIASYYILFRKSLINEFRFLSIDQFKTKIFDEATVDCDIILMEKSKAAEYDVKIQLRNKNIIELVNVLSKNTLSKQKFFNFLLNENQLLLLDKIHSKSLLVKDYFDIKNGVKPYEVGKGYPPQTKKILDEKPYTAETKLNETKMRYEGEIESFKKDLSERLEKINERVSLIDKYSLSILDNKEKGRKL